MANDTPERTIYQKYLGVAGRQDPPDHYTLLGIQPLESDPDTIRAALKRRLDLLETKKDDENASEILRLEKELNEAAECLTSEGARDSYERGVTGESASKTVFTEGEEDGGAEVSADSSQSGISAVSPGTASGTTSAAAPRAGTSPHPGVLPHPGVIPQTGGLYAQPGMMPQAGMMPNPGMMPNGEAAPHGGVYAQPRTAYIPAETGAGEDPYAKFSRMQGTGAGGNLDFGSSPAASGSRSQTSSVRKPGASRKKGKSSSQMQAIPTPVILGAFAVLILIFAGIHSVNSDSGRAKQFHIDAMSAVNAGDFDRGRELIEMAIRLDPKEEYKRYQSQIDKKEKQSEMRRKRQEFREAEEENDDLDFSF